VLENRVLRRIFGPKRNGVTGGFRNLHNEELYNFYFLPSIIRMIKWGTVGWGRAYSTNCAEEEGKKNTYRVLVGKSEGNRPLGRP
jgi:hypothetical protein